MNAAERRNEIISILVVRHHITTKELASELDVSINTIKNDIQALSFAYPIYTKPWGYAALCRWLYDRMVHVSSAGG